MNRRYQTVTSLLALFIFLTGLQTKTSAQKGDTIVIEPKHINTSVLKPGKYSWLNYVVSGKDNIKRNFIYWNLSIEPTTYEGKKAIGIRQSLEFKDSIWGSSYAICDEKTFAPLYHDAWNTPNRKLNVDFVKKTLLVNEKPITASDTAQRNKAIWNGLDSATMCFALNWHVDMVTFPLLPYKDKRTFLINFYEPGSWGVRQVAFTVTGSDYITSFDNTKIDCWQLESKNQYSRQVYWISKKTKEVLKLEEEFGGNKRYKIKLGFNS